MKTRPLCWNVHSTLDHQFNFVLYICLYDLAPFNSLLHAWSNTIADNSQDGDHHANESKGENADQILPVLLQIVTAVN